jgi:translation initiation factor IF-3
VRLVDESGEQEGIMNLSEALQKARERGLDLVQVTERVDPPVCKIMDYGKYLYQLQKKEKSAKKSTEIKGVRLRFNISLHDLETRANLAEKFLKKGDLVKIEMVLRGREKGLPDFAKEKVNQFLEILEKRIPVKVEKALRRVPRGFIMIISKDKKEQE